jgi:hypothetical protein
MRVKAHFSDWLGTSATWWVCEKVVVTLFCRVNTSFYCGKKEDQKFRLLSKVSNRPIHSEKFAQLGHPACRTSLRSRIKKLIWKLRKTFQHKGNSAKNLLFHPKVSFARMLNYPHGSCVMEHVSNLELQCFYDPTFWNDGDRNCFSIIRLLALVLEGFRVFTLAVLLCVT